MNAIPSPRPVRFSTRGRGSTLRKKPRPRRRPPRPRRRPRDAQARRSASHSYTTSRRRRCRHPRTRCPRSPIRRAARRRRCRASARAARASRPWTLRPPCASLSTASPSCAYWTLPTPRTSRRARRTGARSPREDDNCRSASSRAASSRRVAATPRRHCKDAETSVQMTRVATPRPQTGSPHQHVKTTGRGLLPRRQAAGAAPKSHGRAEAPHRLGRDPLGAGQGRADARAGCRLRREEGS